MDEEKPIREVAQSTGVLFNASRKTEDKNCDNIQLERNPVFTREQEDEMASQVGK